MRKQLTKEEWINWVIKTEGIDANKISDGYHTFGELYDHRIALFIVLCNHIQADPTEGGELTGQFCWKSKAHYDGSIMEGWFIAGIGREKGEQISYHLPDKVWDKLRVPTYITAPHEWDGHTSEDVIKRLYTL